MLTELCPFSFLNVSVIEVKKKYVQNFIKYPISDIHLLIFPIKKVSAEKFKAIIQSSLTSSHELIDIDSA